MSWEGFSSDVKSSVHALKRLFSGQYSRPLIYLLIVAAVIDILFSLFGKAPIFVIIATAVILLWYTQETYEIRKVSSQQTTFAALAQIHSTLTHPRIYEALKKLHQDFDTLWPKVMGTVQETQQHPTLSKISDAHGNIYPDKLALVHVVEEREVADRQAALRRFNSELEQAGLLEPIEAALASLEIITLPFVLGIEAARNALFAHALAFNRAAPFLLKFIAVQMYLRCDPTYNRFNIEALVQVRAAQPFSLDSSTNAILTAIYENGAEPPGIEIVRMAPLRVTSPRRPQQRRPQPAAGSDLGPIPME